MVQSYYGTSLKSIEHIDDVDDGKKYLAHNEVDLLLLDLNLNGEDGFEVLKKMVASSFHTIIISAYKEKAIQAFEYGVLDFVPKPFKEERLIKALGRYNHQEAGVVRGIKYLAIRKRGSQHLISVDQISHIQGARIYTEIYLTNKKKAVHAKSLDKLSHLLPSSFVRIHKSYIANMDKARAIHAESGGKYTLELEDGSHIPVSRGKYKGIKGEWFG